MLTLHQRRTHRRPVDGCYGCRLSSVQVATSPAVKQVESRERALSKDLAAYRSLRRQGYQPEHLAGSAQVEATATDRFTRTLKPGRYTFVCDAHTDSMHGSFVVSGGS